MEGAKFRGSTILCCRILRHFFESGRRFLPAGKPTSGDWNQRLVPALRPATSSLILEAFGKSGCRLSKSCNS